VAIITRDRVVKFGIWLLNIYQDLIRWCRENFWHHNIS